MIRTDRSPAAPVRSRIYEKILSDLLGERRYAFVADLLEDAKRRCARLRIPYRDHELDAAATVMRERLQREVRATSARPNATVDTPPPLTRTEAAAILAHLAARLPVTAALKPVPNARPLTVREDDKRRALRVVAAAIRDSVERCEALEANAPKDEQ